MLLMPPSVALVTKQLQKSFIPDETSKPLNEMDDQLLGLRKNAELTSRVDRWLQRPRDFIVYATVASLRNDDGEETGSQRRY